MKHETAWKRKAIGKPTPQGGGVVLARTIDFRDFLPTGGDAAGRRTLVACLSAQRRRRLEGQTGAGASLQTDPPAEAAFAEGFAGWGTGRGVLHESMDLSAREAIDSQSNGGVLPRRSYPAAAVGARFFPLKSRRYRPRNVTRRRLSDGLSATGRESNDWRSAAALRSFSSTKQGFCSLRWCGEPGRRADKRRFCVCGCGITAGSRPLVDCPSRRSADISDGI